MLRHRLPLLRTVLSLSLALIVVVGLVLAFGRIDRVVVAHGKITGGERVVRAPVAGKISSLSVTNGQFVEEGELLLQLEDEELRTRERSLSVAVEGLQRSLGELRARQTRLEGEVHPQQYAQAKHFIDRAQLRLDSAKRKAKRLGGLGTGGLVAELEIENAELERQLAELDIKQSTLGLDRLKETQAEELMSLDEQVREGADALQGQQYELTNLENKLTRLRVEAEVSGVVFGLEPLEQGLGIWVEEGRELMRISEDQAERFEGHINGQGRSFVQVGQIANVRVRAYPWLLHGSAKGTVSFVAPSAVALAGDERGQPRRPLGFPIRLELEAEDSPGILFAGMKGEARVVIEAQVRLGSLLVEKIFGADSL